LYGAGGPFLGGPLEGARVGAAGEVGAGGAGDGALVAGAGRLAGAGAGPFHGGDGGCWAALTAARTE
jgi:hypothetical protein